MAEFLKFSTLKFYIVGFLCGEKLVEILIIFPLEVRQERTCLSWLDAFRTFFFMVFISLTVACLGMILRSLGVISGTTALYVSAEKNTVRAKWQMRSDLLEQDTVRLTSRRTRKAIP